eukprot:12547470-Alexandrium_andersonii.AAC.1
MRGDGAPVLSPPGHGARGAELAWGGYGSHSTVSSKAPQDMVEVRAVLRERFICLGEEFLEGWQDSR